MPRKKVAKVEPSRAIMRIQEGFSNRFNIPNFKSGRKQFKNRCITSVGVFLTWLSKEEIDDLTITISKLVGIPLPISPDVFERGTDDEFEFERSRIYKLLDKFEELSKENHFYIWLMIIEVIANVSCEEIDAKKNFAASIAESLELSGINAILCNTADGYRFYPANAELLDIKLVVDVLNWLSAYPDAKEKYDSALRLFLKGNRTRHVLDDCRLSLELLVKQLMPTPASLENQNKAKTDKSGDSITPISKYMKDRGVSKEIRDMYSMLLKSYTDFNNDNVKHKDTPVPENEIEFFIYTTGSFMRFIILLEKNNKR